MNFSSTEFKRHADFGIGRPPRPHENVNIFVDVSGTEYTIDFNTWDILEGDTVTVIFSFDSMWDTHTDRKCAVSIDDRIEVFDLVDDKLTIPRHLVRNCDIQLYVKGFYEDGSEGSIGKPRPKEYDEPYSEDNEFGCIDLDMFDTPIKIGSWYDR